MQIQRDWLFKLENIPETRWDHCLETKTTTAPAKEKNGADIEIF